MFVCSKYMVGVLDKKTGKVRVYSSEMYNLQPQLAGTDNVFLYDRLVYMF